MFGVKLFYIMETTRDLISIMAKAKHLFKQKSLKPEVVQWLQNASSNPTFTNKILM